MDCNTFSDLLEAFLKERLGDRDEAAFLEHAERCAACRAMLEPPGDLAGAILERTSGATCESARALLCAHMVDELDRTDSELAGMHLASCPDCAALCRALARLDLDLPALADLEPDSGFVGDVLASTVEARPARRIERMLRSLWQRPRIALEGAYVGAFIFALIFVTPASPLAGVPRRAIELAKVNPVAELAEPVEKIQSQVSSEARSIWSEVAGHALEAWRGTAGFAERFAKDIGTLLEGFASEQETEEENNDQGDER
jgi:hypothetical protein